jgi:hypothetical protein
MGSIPVETTTEVEKGHPKTGWPFSLRGGPQRQRETMSAAESSLHRSVY